MTDNKSIEDKLELTYELLRGFEHTYGVFLDINPESFYENKDKVLCKETSFERTRGFARFFYPDQEVTCNFEKRKAIDGPEYRIGISYKCTGDNDVKQIVVTNNVSPDVLCFEGMLSLYSKIIKSDKVLTSFNTVKSIFEKLPESTVFPRRI